MSHHECPVCFFQEMPYPANDFNICPCCGTHFELDDAAPTWIETLNRRRDLGSQWLANGAQFWSNRGAPPNWNPNRQIALLFQSLGLMKYAGSLETRETKSNPALSQVGVEHSGSGRLRQVMVPA